MHKSVENPSPTKKVTAIKAISAETIKLMGQADRGEIPVMRALMQLGISEVQARKGWTLVKARRSLREALAAAKSEELHQLRADEATHIDANADIARINARLRSNITSGEDKAVNSCKLLGSRKDLNMWTADSVAGMVVIGIPSAMPQMPTIIDAGQIQTAEPRQLAAEQTSSV